MFANIRAKYILLALLLAAVFWPLALTSDAGRPGVESEVLLRADSSWNNVPYEAYPKGAPELTVLKITIPAHETLAWHTHPMPNAAYVLSGEIIAEDQGGLTRRFAAGEAVPEMVNTVHRGSAGDAPAVLIVFYAGVKGMPLSQPKP